MFFVEKFDNSIKKNFKQIITKILFLQFKEKFIYNLR